MYSLTHGLMFHYTNFTLNPIRYYFMRVLTLKTQTPANIKYPEYMYTIDLKYYFHRASGVYGKTHA